MAEEKAYVGYRSAGRRPESRQDRRAAADAPLSALRGAVSGVLGAPGDIESLIRMLPGLSERTALPTSEDVEKRLPLPELNRTPTGRAFTTAGQLGGGFYGGPGSPLRAVAALPSAVTRAAGDFARAGSPVHAVKRGLPPELQGLAQRLADEARAAHPEAAVEFANNGHAGFARGTVDALSPELLKYEPGGTALHTHGYAERVEPSFLDFKEWAQRPEQRYLGVVRPDREGSGLSAVIIDPRGAPLPTEKELSAHQMRLNKEMPEMVRRLDNGESEASKWKTLLDKARADEIDLYLHNVDPPAELLSPKPAPDAEGFASGGVVQMDSAKIQSLVDTLREEMYG